MEENILLIYPYPVFFYVHKDYLRLTERMEKGLNLMIQEGSFDTLFFKYNGEVIEKAKLRGRKIFRIETPGLPSYVLLHKKELWYDPLAH